MTRTSRNETAPKAVKETEGTALPAEASERDAVQDRLKGFEDDFRDVTYSSDNPLEIPIELENRMLDEGYKLRWVRYLTGGETDAKNLRTRKMQGYSFVTLDDVGEIAQEFGMLSGNANETDFVIFDDLALMKIKVERQAENEANVSEKARKQIEDVNRGYDKHNFSNSSESRVSGGNANKYNIARDK